MVPPVFAGVHPWTSRDATGVVDVPDAGVPLLDATDELVADHFIGEATWARLASLTEQQRMDLVFAVGQYTQVSMILNTFGVPLDPGQELDADFPSTPR